MSRNLAIALTIIAPVALGFAWPLMHLWPVLLAPPLVGFAALAAWVLTGRYGHDVPSLIAAFVVFLILFLVGAYIPDLILTVVLDRNATN